MKAFSFIHRRGGSLRLICALAALLTLCALDNASAGGRKSITVIPENGKSIPVTVAGKAKTYYLLRPNAAMRIEVDGPGKLTVLSRLLMAAGGSGSESYTVKLLQGKKALKIHATQSTSSDATVAMQGLVPAKGRKFTFPVGEGSSAYELALENTSRDVAVRIQFQPDKQRGKLVSLQPLSYDKIVTCLVSEKLIAYYVSSTAHDVQLRVVGPTKVRVSTRLNYDESMKGGQKYSVIVTEGGKEIARKALQTTKSVGVNYKEWKEVVPGKVVAFTIDVPSGEHTYRFGLGQSIAHSVSVKFSIPSKDLSNEE